MSIPSIYLSTIVLLEKMNEIGKKEKQKRNECKLFY